MKKVSTMANPFTIVAKDVAEIVLDRLEFAKLPSEIAAAKVAHGPYSNITQNLETELSGLPNAIHKEVVQAEHDANALTSFIGPVGVQDIDVTIAHLGILS
jgi:hypothetical protein